MSMRIRLSAILISMAFLAVACAPPELTPAGTAYVYGVTDYGILANLSSPDDDARDMANVFENAGYTVHLRINDGSTTGGSPATLEQLQTDITDFIAESSEDELFVFYYAGHGGRYDELFYSALAPDGLPAPPAGEEPFNASDYDEWIFLYESLPAWSYETWDGIALKDDDLADMLEAIPGNRKLVIIDACKSGGFLGDSPFADPVPQDYDEEDSPVYSGLRTYFGFSNDSVRDIAAGNAFVLSAAGELEDSIETNANGVFTAAFLEAATNADLNDDGYITLMETYRYIADSWDSRPYTSSFHPHITGSAVDIVLFRID